MAETEWPRGLTLARVFVLMPLLQFVGCAVDITGQQATIMAPLCTVASSNTLQIMALAIWAVLVLSLPLGFAAIRFPRLRPLYLLLFALIPLAAVTQGSLVEAKIFTCDSL